MALGSLAAAVLLHFFFHSFFVPAYEGPDEPFHLARVGVFLQLPIGEALVGAQIPGAIVSTVGSHPCSTGKYRTAGCQSSGAGPTYFNLLSPHRPAEGVKPSTNPEANQPPLFYLAAAIVSWFVSPIKRLADSPDSLLLFVRLFAVALVTVAILWPLRRLALSRSFRFVLARASGAPPARCV